MQAVCIALRLAACLEWSRAGAYMSAHGSPEGLCVALILARVHRNMILWLSIMLQTRTMTRKKVRGNKLVDVS